MYLHNKLNLPSQKLTILKQNNQTHHDRLKVYIVEIISGSSVV
jgi:hypothetical protein